MQNNSADVDHPEPLGVEVAIEIMDEHLSINAAQARQRELFELIAAAADKIALIDAALPNLQNQAR